MPEVTTSPQTQSTPESITRTPGAQELIEKTATRLNNDDLLELYEGKSSGALYTESQTGFMKMSLEAGEPVVESVPEPNEDMHQLLRIEPTSNETITDAVDNIRYTGGD